ncbi:hypothetical protein M406DRAFT_268404 [Cryphonectria parasitica EP155]|uniref:Methyltransferase n=1 Tax=Cryphonectria parasitica (strain ATCC 38755 / EP155) TaxID=660469 RepID=A0A9P4XTV4_CRYP1|nr:uncharacterized protein M406DRAFT_268404 [Cryphonectria parasitica EP155]KAF3761152.1 hypothetical protein M406DRAFT_268404 [Cryphonectria parasitica EP155]
MPTSPRENRRDVRTKLKYYDDPGDGTLPLPVIVKRLTVLNSNTVTNERPYIEVDVTIKDVAGCEAEFNLDDHGFCFVRHNSSEKQFLDKTSIENVYFAEVQQLVKKITGASRVVLFDHKVRRGPSDWHKLGKNNRLNAGPLHRVHVDQSYAGAELALRQHLPDEADDLLRQRYQIINIWRPIQTIFKDPIAVADASSVSDDDLVAASVIKPTSVAETWTVRPNPDHRWFYKGAQQPDEVLLIKCFDSDTSVARRAPHSAFRDAAYDGGEDRQSIEVRVLVIYE